MNTDYSRLKSESLKELFVKEIEAKIISGQLKPGDRLPPEREIASLMGISRNVVNSGILELQSKGFVKIIPRKGTLIVDYKKEGTPLILSSIMNFNEGKMSLKLFESLMDTRLLIELECAGLAAVNRTDEDLEALEKLILDVKENLNDLESFVEFNYRFHHQVTIASGNIVYGMIFKSFEPVCKNLIRLYFQDGDYFAQSLAAHEKLHEAIKDKDKKSARELMKEILFEGREELTRLLS
ncbi:MAG TPA: FadR/GntR family transcriptional regulator [Sedimentibacter sp.]|nr:FadR/GntR family transcriptional regulator [Sedimentibacter sp.]